MKFQHFVIFVAGFLSLDTGFSKVKRIPVSPNTLSVHEIWSKSAGPLSGDVFLLTKYGNFFLDEQDFESETLVSSSFRGKKLPPHPMTMHGFAWDYDLRIPIVFFDPTQRWFKPGTYKNIAVQQDIAPTLAEILNIPPPARNGGRILMEAITTETKKKIAKTKPRAILVFVQDQGGRTYYEAHPGKAPFYESMMNKGSNFVNGSVAHVDVETSVGHAAVGTGAWPPESGVTNNNFFHTGLWRQVKAMTMPTSGERKENITGHSGFLLAPTLADVWMSATEGKAKIFSQAYAVRAAIGMGGHGAMFEHGKKTNVVWMDESDSHGEFYQTDEKNYTLPASYHGNSVRPYVDRLIAAAGSVNKSWYDHELIDPEGKLNGRLVKASPAASIWEADLAIAAIKELQIGQDDITDLIFINMKATDGCGHLFGYESDECGEVLSATDRGAKKIFDAVSAATSGNFLAVLTADHGAAPLPEIAGTARFSRQRLISDLNRKFDRRDNHIDVVMTLTSSQLYLNRGELQMNGFKVADVVKYLKAYRVPFRAPFNALADEWIKKGKAKEQLFFEEVLPKEELMKTKTTRK